MLTGLKLAFHAGEQLTTQHLLAAVPEIRPLSKTDPERVAAMTAWLDRHTKPASLRPGDAATKLNGTPRSRKVAV